MAKEPPLLFSTCLGEFNLSEFSEFLSDKGLESAEELESFLNDFMIDPTLLFNLTAKEKADLESQMDTALALFEKV